MKWPILSFVLFGISCGVLAQNAPAQHRVFVPGRYSMRDDDVAPAPAFASGPLGVYVLNRGVLARFDAKTLVLQQGPVELFGKLTDLTNDEIAAQQGWSIADERGQRLLPAGMVLHGGDLLILSGDRFFRVDAATLAVKVSASLLPDKQQWLRTSDFFEVPAPTMECSGDILYRLFLSQRIPVSITAIDSNTGKVLAEKSLPAELSNADFKYIKGGLTFDYSNYNSWPPLAPVQLKATADAVYVLCYGGLAKLDPKTLEPVKVKALYGPMVNVDDDSSADAKTAASIEQARRKLPGVLFLQGKDLLIVSGDDFFRVNADTLDIDKQTQLTQVADNARATRMNQLVGYRQPQVLLTRQGLLVTRGKECVLVNPQDGAVHALSLPEPLTRPLPFLRPREHFYAPTVPKDGETVRVNGVVWSKTEGDNITWLCYDERIGTVKLTGAKIDAISNDPNNQQGQLTVMGVFHKLADGGPDKLVGTVDTIDTPFSFQLAQNFFSYGTIHQRKVGEATIWTISGMTEGSEYVLVGDKLKALTAMPNIDGRQASIGGYFSRDYQKMPHYGQGYLDIQSSNVRPTAEDAADKQDLANQALAAATGDCFFVLRNGVIARFDAATLKQTAVYDLLPPAPEIPKDAAVSEELITAISANRNLRLSPPLLIPQGADLGVVVGHGYALLDGATLAVKAQQAQGKAAPVTPSPYSSGAPNYLVDGASLFTIAYNDTNLLRYDLALGNPATTVALPEKMMSKVYSSQN